MAKAKEDCQAATTQLEAAVDTLLKLGVVNGEGEVDQLALDALRSQDALHAEEVATLKAALAAAAEEISSSVWATSDCHRTLIVQYQGEACGSSTPER